jgi:hypothetical protein
VLTFDPGGAVFPGMSATSKLELTGRRSRGVETYVEMMVIALDKFGEHHDSREVQMWLDARVDKSSSS